MSLRALETDLLDQIARTLAAIVSFAQARARAVAAVIGLIATLCAFYASSHFAISTDLDGLLDRRLPWRAEAQRIEGLFPGQSEDITVVIDGATPERAEQAAASLTRALAGHSGVFRAVQRVNGGAFFDRQGLLYGSTDDLRHAMDKLVGAQPLLATLASDPSLRGLLASLSVSANNKPLSGEAELRLEHAATEIGNVIRQARAHQPAFLSLRNLFTGDASDSSEWRQFVEITPKLDYGSATPGASAVRVIQGAARQLSLDRAHGIVVRISGSAPIADEELATLRESSGTIALAMLVCMIGVLYLATRSARAILAVIVTVVAGAIVTTAIGLVLFGQFNLVSIAFLPLFIGLGIDFCIQLLARCASEDAALKHVMARASLNIGAGLTLAACAISLAFFAFLPTSYRGVAELGMTAGLGIGIALFLCVTLLPALMSLFGANFHHEAEVSWLISIDRGLIERPLPILAVAAAAFAASALLLPHLTFDFDPMHLRNPHTEAVSVYEEMSRDPETTPNTVNLTAPNLEAAKNLAERLRQMPQVGQVSSLLTLIPEDQLAKLAIISNANALLDFSLNPFEVAPPPSDGENIVALRAAAAALRGAGASAPVRALADLAGELDALAAASPSDRLRVTRALMDGLPTALDDLRSALTPAPLTPSDLPPEIRRSWLAPNGVARIEVAPAHALQTPNQNREFVDAVRRVAPLAAGDAVTIVESGNTIVSAFAIAGILSAVSIAVLLGAALGSVRWVAATLAPVLLAGALTFATCALTGIAINLENMIALPLLLGIGVAFNVYLVTAWRRGARGLLASNLGRGVWFSAATTGLSFAALLMSAHPGTASMGALLLVSLVWIVATTCIVTPALLAALVPVSTEALA